MRIIYDKPLSEFTPREGAIETFNRLRDEGKLDTLERILQDLYPSGMSEGELNDLLWFERESVYEWVGCSSDSEPNIKSLPDYKTEYGTLVPISRMFLFEEFEYPIDSSEISEDEFRKIITDLEWDAQTSFEDNQERQVEYFWEHLEERLLNAGAKYV